MSKRRAEAREYPARFVRSSLGKKDRAAGDVEEGAFFWDEAELS